MNGETLIVAAVMNTTLCIVCYFIARKKGFYQPWLYGLFGFLFGILALAVVFFSPKDVKKCPMCANQIRKEALICQYCRNEFAKSN